MEWDDSLEIMSAEEFFVGIAKDRKSSSRKKCHQKKKTSDELFNEVKTKMVMRIYGVTRDKALEIITKIENEKLAAKEDKEKRRREKHGKRVSCSDDEELMSWEEFLDEE